MARRPLRVQPLLCAVGIHVIPPPRDPNGPVVAFCKCCRRALYCYGIENSAWNIYPNLMLPDFPRILGPVGAQQGAVTQITASGIRLSLLEPGVPSHV